VLICEGSPEEWPGRDDQAWHLIDQRIDYVLAWPGTPAHPVVVSQAFLAGDPQYARCPSDHYAAVANFRL
jgi:hypothetical protein